MLKLIGHTADADSRRINLDLDLGDSKGEFAGWQVYDPDSGMFISEGNWMPVRGFPGVLPITLPPERGRYQVYVSTLDDSGWAYQRGRPFLLIEAAVEAGRLTVTEVSSTTLRALRRRKLGKAISKAFTLPFESIWQNRNVIRSMVRRDILARYKGSFGDVLWTVLNPLLLMATYFFVFGVVLQSRFGADNSRTGFALYFLAGMLPWLAFSEAVGRAPQVILEHRNFVKKLVFPVETLPLNAVLSGLVTQGFGTALFLIALLAIRKGIPPSALWAPMLLIPQVLFTAGTAWFLAALGVYVRDLGQVIGFVLTLWFFLTPICYPESLLPAGAVNVLTKNPFFVLVHGYRAIFLEGQAPSWSAVWKLWIVGGMVFLGGHAWFYKLRKSFADVI